MTTGKEDKMLLARLEDRALQAQRRNIFTWGGFLDSRQSVLAKELCAGLGLPLLLWGGYEGAERQIPLFLPDYMTEEDAKQDDGPLQLLRVQTAKGARTLSHRDYLGSLLALGIKRELTGDILVRENGADIVILREIGEFLLSSYQKAGRENLQVSLSDISQLQSAEQRTEEIRDSLASVRLDALVAAAFRMSRGKAQEAVAQGLVAVNGLQCLKPDFSPAEGDRISFKGKGKAVLTEIGGSSRKGRQWVTLQKYL